MQSPYAVYKLSGNTFCDCYLQASASVVPRGRDLLGYSLTSEAGDALHEEDVPPKDAPADQSHGTPSWEGWLRHFGQADTADDAQTAYREKLQVRMGCHETHMAVQTCACSSHDTI